MDGAKWQLKGVVKTISTALTCPVKMGRYFITPLQMLRELEIMCL